MRGPNKVSAVRFSQYGRTRAEVGLWMIDTPVPEYGPNNLLIRIKITDICVTDIHICNRDKLVQKTNPVPMIAGHECAGVTEKVGSEVKGFHPDDRVTGYGQYYMRLVPQLQGR